MTDETSGGLVWKTKTTEKPDTAQTKKPVETQAKKAEQKKQAPTEKPSSSKISLGGEASKEKTEVIERLSGELAQTGLKQTGAIAKALASSGVTSLSDVKFGQVTGNVSLGATRGKVVDGAEAEVTEKVLLSCTASYTASASTSGVRRAGVIAIKSNTSKTRDIYPSGLNFLNDENTLNVHFQSGCGGGGDPNSITLRMTADFSAQSGMAVGAGENVEVVVLLDPENKQFIAVAAKPNGETSVKKGEMNTNVVVSGVGYTAKGGKSNNSIEMKME